MELCLLKFYKISENVDTRSSWTLPVPDSFNLYFILWIFKSTVINLGL